MTKVLDHAILERIAHYRRGSYRAESNNRRRGRACVGDRQAAVGTAAADRTVEGDAACAVQTDERRRCRCTRDHPGRTAGLDRHCKW